MSDQINSTNPSNAFTPIGTVTVTSPDEIKKKVSAASIAKEQWKNIGIKGRIAYISALLTIYKKRSSAIASIISKEIGTPLTQCVEEIEWDWSYSDWFMSHAVEALQPTVSGSTPSSIHTIYYEPLGVAAVITPWNLPFDMFIWGVIPNLLAGNTVVYKAAEECVLTGELMEQIAIEAGLPEGVLSFVHGGAQQGQQLVEQPIDLIWFTGSTSVGQSLYEKAGKKGIKVLSELGGSNPAIIFEDANIDAAVSSVISKRFMFSGQTCDADKRLIVHASIFDQVVEKLKSAISSMILGNPEDAHTTMGPLVSKKQLDTLIDQVEDAKKLGATIVIGGNVPIHLSGAYYLPTLMTNISPSMRVWKEEVFGPVLPVVSFNSEEEAIALANDTEYGLGSQIFTKDLKKAHRIAEQLQVGNVDINGVGHFHPFNPFGGYKKSGMGREHGIHGFQELTQVKIVSSPKV